VAAKLKTEGAAFVSKVNATIGFQIAAANNETFSYVLDLKNSPGSVYVNTNGTIFFSKHRLDKFQKLQLT
jgi:hypothetical protein